MMIWNASELIQVKSIVKFDTQWMMLNIIEFIELNSIM